MTQLTNSSPHAPLIAFNLLLIGDEPEANTPLPVSAAATVEFGRLKQLKGSTKYANRQIDLIHKQVMMDDKLTDLWKVLLKSQNPKWGKKDLIELAACEGG